MVTRLGNTSEVNSTPLKLSERGSNNYLIDLNVKVETELSEGHKVWGH